MRPSFRFVFVIALYFSVVLRANGAESENLTGAKADGYRGIWFTIHQASEYGDKYSGGLGTYTSQHLPLAVYVPEVDKTFFVYGGSLAGERHLLVMASYYDHKSKSVPQPTIVHDKQGVDDPHDNPSLAIDEAGHLWIFVAGRSNKRTGFIYRSVQPYSIDEFQIVGKRIMTYSEPWWIQGRGFLHLFTKYTRGRELYFNTSRDGITWTKDKKLAGMGGHYQVSIVRDGKLFTAFNMHPMPEGRGGDPDSRTNLYVVQTDDMGETWQSIDGRQLELPLTDVASPALVHDYRAEGRLVYLNDINLDRAGRPVVLYVTSAYHQPGPQGEPRIWTIARWTGSEWRFHDVTRSTSNYDMGSLYLEDDDEWRIIGPTEPGPFHWGTGGEMALWVSGDHGANWKKARDITRHSEFNHSYARRPVNARDDFYAFWADGAADKHSRSRLYFTDKTGERVWQLPYDMNEDFAKPELISTDK